MSIQSDQLRSLIHQVLSRLADQAGMPELYTHDAVELLMLTAAQETHCGRYIRQVKGPALGIFQMEPSSYSDLIQWLERTKPELYEACQKWVIPEVNTGFNLMGNLPYQIVMARAFYYRKPGKLPSHKNLGAVAAYWKKWFNTHLGKGTTIEAMENYSRFAI